MRRFLGAVVANRIRGVKINGRLTSNANNLSVSFSDIASATSSNAVLVDNTGMP